MDLVAVQNFKSVERFLAEPGIPAAQDVHTLGRTETRVFLRHLVAEQNRFYFEQWEWSQLAFGLGFVLLLVFGSRPPKLAILFSLGMLAIVLAQRFGLTPQISKLGRELDFSTAAGSSQKTTFWTLHGIYSGVELLKIAFALVVAGLFVIRRQPDKRMFAREIELDEVSTGRKARA